MKWIIACLLALFVVPVAFAGEDPYIGIVGNDVDFNAFYWSAKQQQFLYDESTVLGLPATNEEKFECGFGTFSKIDKDEFCDATGTHLGNLNCKAGAGNRGRFEWVIRLPKKPSGEINICLQCGVLKPNTDVLTGIIPPIEVCAAETGERLDFGFCNRNFVGPGVDPIIPGALPKITAIAFPGPANFFFPFYLTAYKNPGTYKLPFWSLNSNLKPGGDSQTLDGSTYSRILLKACMDKCVVVKIPTDGQINAGPGFVPPFSFPCTPTSTAAGSTCLPPLDLPGLSLAGTPVSGNLGFDFNTRLGLPATGAGNATVAGIPVSREEFNLIEGDLVYIRVDVPNTNTVDIFCNEESASIRGIGENPN